MRRKDCKAGMAVMAYGNDFKDRYTIQMVLLDRVRLRHADGSEVLVYPQQLRKIIPRRPLGEWHGHWMTPQDAVKRGHGHVFVPENCCPDRGFMRLRETRK